MDNVLVAYATKSGSTGEVAEAIAKTLRHRGATVTVVPATRAKDPVDRYDLIVLGGALYNGRWHSGARRFLRRHRRELGATPVAVFGMGPLDDVTEAWQRSRAQLDKALGKRAWLSPVAVTVFGGADPATKKVGRDLRDWNVISAWAEDVADALPSGPPPSPVA